MGHSTAVTNKSGSASAGRRIRTWHELAGRSPAERGRTPRCRNLVNPIAKGHAARPSGLLADRREGLVGDRERAVDVGLRMRDRDVELLVRVDEQPALDELERPGETELLVGRGEIDPGAKRPPVGEPHPEHRVLTGRLDREPMALPSSDDPGAQARADAVKMIVDAVLR